jgi:hypothetical protein
MLMVSAVKSRPSHYEVLGLAPTASEAEIAAAFAARMGPFGARPWAAAAEMSLAFETLRDPAKRRAYDSALGLRLEPAVQPRVWTMIPPQPGAVTFARAAPEQAERAVAPPPPPPPPVVEPARPEAPAVPEPAAAWDEPRFGVRERPAELRRAAAVVGVLVLAAGGVGIAAGLSAGGEAGDVAAVTVPLPDAKLKTEVAAAAVAPVAKPAGERAEQPVRPEPVEAPAESRPEPRVASAAPPPSNRIESIASGLVESQPALADAVATPAPEAVAAGLPLPKSVIARTIDRIGFSCGSVASASAVEGSAGVFRIDCSSGQSYRAAPVQGRYHFRRWSGE